jgi:SAM-dependent methyltransferase
MPKERVMTTGAEPIEATFYRDPSRGPTQQALDALHERRLRALLPVVPGGVQLLELGCDAGAFAPRDLVGSYVGVGLTPEDADAAARALEAWPCPIETLCTDMRQLPYRNDSFDAVFSSYTLSGLDTVAQSRVIAEMSRVVRPGGRVIIVTENPRALLSPPTLIKRAVADAPLLGKALSRARGGSETYEPRSVGWMRAELSEFGEVTTLSLGVPSEAMRQRADERRWSNRALWAGVYRMERHLPRTAARLGSYVVHAALIR